MVKTLKMRELTYTNSRKCMLPKDYTKSSKFFERNYAVLVSIFASIGALCIGTCIGWSSAAIHVLSSNTFPLTIENMTPRQVSWIVSGFCLGAALSPLLVYKIWRFMGSKLLILMGCGFLLTSWVLLSLFQSLITILCARLLGGIGVGCLHLLLPIYIQDIASSEVRVTLDYIWHTFLAAGIFIEYAAVLLKNYQLINIVSAVAPVILFVGFLFMPESPRYLCYKGESNVGKEMLRKFREIGDEVDQDVHYWCNKKTENFALRNVAKHPSSLRRIMPVIGLIVFDQLGGVLGSFFFLSWNFRILGGEFTPELSALIIAAVFLVSISVHKLIGITLSDKSNLIWTSVLQAVTLLVLGFYVHYKGSYIEIEEYNSLPLICYGIYVFLYGMGLHRISWKYIRYLIPRSRYFVARAICTSVSWIILVFFTRGYVSLIEFVGIGWLFWFMALSCIALVIFTAVFVPGREKMESKYQFEQDYISQDIEHDSH